MQKRFSLMTHEELQIEAERLRDEGERLIHEGNLSQANILKQRYFFCLSYMMNPEEIVLGKSYSIIDEDKEMIVDYVNGVMAWGCLLNQPFADKIAFPIAQLVPSKSSCAGECNCHH